MLRRALFLLPALALPARAQTPPPAPRPLVLAEDAMLRLGRKHGLATAVQTLATVPPAPEVIQG